LTLPTKAQEVSFRQACVAEKIYRRRDAGGGQTFPMPHDCSAVDIQTPPPYSFSVLGYYPKYKMQYEDADFKYDLDYSALIPWYMFNDGIPWRTGDFGWYSINELACGIEGTILHKETKKTFRVKGTGVLEDSIGLPCNWVDWGTHDYLNIEFPSGWYGSLWKARDDWQWGYNPYPQTGWIYDPERKEFHTFHRVEIVEREMGHDDTNDRGYALRTLWRAIAKGGTLNIETKNVSYNPTVIPIAFTPFSKKLSYGKNVHHAWFVRTDGTTVELKDGYGLQEDFYSDIPDYRYIGPGFLILLILSWGATAAAMRSRDKKSLRGVYAAMVIGIFAVGCLYWLWLTNPAP